VSARTRSPAVIALLCVVAARAFPASDAVVFSAAAWDFGTVDRTAKPEMILEATNRSSGRVAVSLVPACDCLTVRPARVVVAPGATVGFRIAFDPSDEEGTVSRTIVILTDAPGGGRRLFAVTGTVQGGAAAAGTSPSPVGEPSGTARVRLTYYAAPGCRSCERFLADELPRIARAQGVAVEVVRRDVLAEDGYGEYARAAAALGATVHAIPGLLVGDGILLQGEEEIRARLAAALAGGPAAVAAAPASPAAPARAAVLSAIPVLAGGLLDGINPCAFTTLVFLIASLAAAGRDRRQLLLIGILFTLAVFATYFAVGLGLFSALRAAAGVPLVSRIIRWLLVAVLGVLAALSVRDAVLAARGRAADMTLQLPDALKRRIRASIRTRTGSAALAAAALALGFVVSVFEFACTGQVYLPTLAYLARLGDARAVPLLAAYNLAFIAPLVAVFAASWAGVSSHRLGAFLQRHLVAAKAAFAVFFAGLAVLTLAT
jgi:hypothetical protein